uniref:Reverse transcriptase domain-containing protein n=1 Tax=Nicotiana tabacum TaxID=4097 RepID=A0A1S4CH59_TOBAC|nr:PREDICTED: uncharacterized protein LOC107818927 [Nicotiana tabacum]
MVKAFFNGHELPRYITHTNLVLLPKKKEVVSFSDMRPISLSNFINKEIITDIRLRTKPVPNVVIKLDMTKAYDQLSWIFLTKVLRKMGFGERFIGLVFGIISNNWYSVLLNGQPHGFLDQPELIIEVLAAYEAASGQLINKSKSTVYLHHSASDEVVDKVQRITGIPRQDFPFTYLGCPIFYTLRRMDYYQGLITNVMDKLQNWKVKLLSIGWRAVLISHVLQSMPIHLLSIVNPPANMINRLHKIFAQLFWGNSIGVASRHWASWNTLCLPCEEGGVGSDHYMICPQLYSASCGGIAEQSQVYGAPL